MFASRMARVARPAAFVAFAGVASATALSRPARAEPSLSELEARMGSIESSLAGPSAAAVEAKFTKFWPRKIMILFGPPCVHAVDPAAPDPRGQALRRCLLAAAAPLSSA